MSLERQTKLQNVLQIYKFVLLLFHFLFRIKELRKETTLENHLTTTQTARILDVTPSCVRQWIAKGKLPALRIGSRWNIKPSDVKAVISYSPLVKETANG